MKQDAYDELARELLAYLDTDESNRHFRNHMMNNPRGEDAYKRPPSYSAPPRPHQQPHRYIPEEAPICNAREFVSHENAYARQGQPPIEKPPKEKDSKMPPLQRALTFLLLAVFIISGGYLAKFYIIDPANIESDSQSLAKLYTAEDVNILEIEDGSLTAFYPEGVLPPETDGQPDGADSPSSADTKNKPNIVLPPGVRDKFAKLYTSNKELVGWIQVPGTKINYPVVQAKNNSYYLNRDFYKKNNRLGAIFIETGQKIGAENTSRNLTIYGHNPKTSAMFGQLINYRNLSFYKKNPVVNFDTLYEDGEWRVFAAIITNANKAQDNGKMFDWRQTDFATDEEFQNFLTEIESRSLYKTGVDVNAEDHLITLTTCVYDFTEARLVVFARKLRPGEDKTAGVSDATVNKKPVYPAAWYKAKK